MRRRARAWRAVLRPGAHSGLPAEGRVGLCVLRIEPCVGGAVYTTYLIADLVGDSRPSASATASLDASLEQIRAFAETLCNQDGVEQ